MNKLYKDSVGLAQVFATTKEEGYLFRIYVGGYDKVPYVLCIRHQDTEYEEQQKAKSPYTNQLTFMRISLLKPEYIRYNDLMTTKDLEWFSDVMYNRWDEVKAIMNNIIKKSSTPPLIIEEYFDEKDNCPDYRSLPVKEQIMEQLPFAYKNYKDHVLQLYLPRYEEEPYVTCIRCPNKLLKKYIREYIQFMNISLIRPEYIRSIRFRDDDLLSFEERQWFYEIMSTQWDKIITLVNEMMYVITEYKETEYFSDSIFPNYLELQVK